MVYGEKGGKEVNFISKMVKVEANSKHFFIKYSLHPGSFKNPGRCNYQQKDPKQHLICSFTYAFDLDL